MTKLSARERIGILTRRVATLTLKLKSGTESPDFLETWKSLKAAKETLHSCYEELRHESSNAEDPSQHD